MGGEYGQRDYSEATAALIDEETRNLVQTAYQQVKNLLIEHKATLERIAQELRRQETIDAKQLSQILVETGVSLAEVAPTPNAETAAGTIPLPDGLGGGNGGNGNANDGGANGNGSGAPDTTPAPGTPTYPTYPGYPPTGSLPPQS